MIQIRFDGYDLSRASDPVVGSRRIAAPQTNLPMTVCRHAVKRPVTGRVSKTCKAGPDFLRLADLNGRGMVSTTLNMTITRPINSEDITSWP
jgi:hypothetical protein